MKTTIKKRIEEINNGIVPEGYEKTSFGIFPCDWKITRIKSIAYLNKQKFNPQENKDNLVCIELEHIVPERGVLNGNTYAQNKHSLKNTFCKGDILFGKLRPYLGKYYHADQKGVCSTEIWVIRNHNTIDNNFLFQLVKGKRFIQSAQDSAFGTKMPRAEWQKVEKEKFVIPTSFREQSRIAEILMQWDKAIELQEKLIEAYQKSKKYYLNKMFPKKGSNVPEIRFPGFTAPWEQCKLGSIVYRASEMSDTDDLPRVEYEDIDAGQGTLNKDLKEKVSTKKGIIFQSGDILYGKLRPYLKNWLFAWFSGIAVGDFWVLRSNQVSQSFIYRLVQTPTFEYIANQSTGSKMPRADWNLVSNTAFAFPTSNEEQEAIGQIFLKLDNLITLHQQKRDKLVAQRKAMQQYLLTGIVRV